MLFYKKITTLLSLCCFAQAVCAEHPLLSEDIGTLGEDVYQIELNTDWLKDGRMRSRVGSLTLMRGVAEDLDIYMNTPATLSSPSGLNDIDLGLKWRFWEVDNFFVGVRPELRLASGDQQKELGDGKSGAALTFVTQYELGSFTWLFNVGSEWHRFSDPAQELLRRSYIYKTSLATLYAIDKQWTVLVDVGKQSHILKSEKSPEAIVFGVIYHIDDAVDMDIGYKKALNHTEVDRQIGVGLTWRFK